MESDSDSSTGSEMYTSTAATNNSQPTRPTANHLIDDSGSDDNYSMPKTAAERQVFGSDSDESSDDDLNNRQQAKAAAPDPKTASQTADLFGSEESSSDDDEATAPEPQAKPAAPRKALILSDDDSDDDDIALPSAANGVGASDPNRSQLENILGGVSSEDDDDDSDQPHRNRRGSSDDDEPSSRRAAAAGEAEEEEPERVIAVDLPYVKADLGRHMKLVKITNFLSVEPRPFDPLTYEDEAHEDEVVDEQGSTRIKLKVENTIRWRTAKDANGQEKMDPATGQPVRESNARFVRWSDGTMSLHLGQEIFDVHPVDIRGNDNYLYIRQGQGLQGQGMFTQKLSFRPHSTDSFTHKKITLSMATKSQNKQNVKILPIVGEDPEQNRRELQKREEERLRATLRRENQQRRLRERQSQRELGSSFLENDDEDNSFSVGAIKQKFKEKAAANKRRSFEYSSESDEDSDISDRPSKPKRKAKIVSDDEDD